MKYVYGMRLRPFSIGCQPSEGLLGLYEEKVEHDYHDLICYDRKLSQEEEDHYSLDLVRVDN